MEAEEGLDLLRRGEVDLVVAEEYDYAPRPREPSLVWRDVCRDPLVIVLPAAHPLAAADPETVPLAALAGEVWATPRSGTAFDDSMVRACRALGGFEPDRRHRSNDLAVLEQLVAAGEAVALMPSLGRPGRVPGVVVRRIAEAPLERSIFLAAAPRQRGPGGAHGGRRGAARAGARDRAAGGCERLHRGRVRSRGRRVGGGCRR